MQFNYIQSFKIDSTKVNNSPLVYITSVELYFKEKPQRNNNSSGIVNPGVTVHICPFNGDTPDPADIIMGETSSVDYGGVAALSDASTPTKFVFNTPVPIKTGLQYGVVIRFEDDDFKLWGAVQDEYLLGTTSKYSGTSSDGDGRLYESSNDITGVRALSDRDIKFNVKVAKFTANSATIDLVNDDYEFFSVSSMLSSPKFVGGETIYQPFGNTSSNTTYSYSGSVSTTKGNSVIKGTSASFTTNYSAENYILLVDTSNTQNQQVAKIFSINDSDTIVMYEGASFTAASCYHTRVPAATIFDADYVNNNIIAVGSTATNSSFRFVTNAVHYFTISAGGSGYSNGATVTVSNGSVNAVATITTNTTGGITNLRLTSAGANFPNTSHSVVTISGSGSSASIVPVIGAPLRGEYSKSTATLTSINNFDVSVIDPDIQISNTAFTTGLSNVAFSNTSYAIQSFTTIPFNEPFDVSRYKGMIASRSNEVRNTTNLYNNDKSDIIRINLGVNVNDVVSSPLFYAPFLHEDALDVIAFKNRVSATTSNTSGEVGSGNTIAKHITKTISFANNTFAEDIRVYVNAYKPANTDIKLYARIHNSADSEAFDDKAWSPLELKDGISVLSAKGSKDDIKEYTYGLPAYPEVEYTANGTGTADSVTANAVILTSVDLTTELSSGDLVRVYDPLFSATNYMVSPVDSVNSTAVVLTSVVSNTGLRTSGLKLDKLLNKTVAFNNIQNDNVVRYYTSSSVEFDNYNSMSIKIVMLADDINITPEIDDIRVIGVSA